MSATTTTMFCNVFVLVRVLYLKRCFVYAIYVMLSVFVLLTTYARCPTSLATRFVAVALILVDFVVVVIVVNVEHVASARRTDEEKKEEEEEVSLRMVTGDKFEITLATSFSRNANKCLCSMYGFKKRKKMLTFFESSNAKMCSFNLIWCE